MEKTTIIKNHLAELHHLCFKNNIPFVSFRSPQSNRIRTLLQLENMPRELHNLDELNNLSGFIITPFFSNSLNTSFVLEPDIIAETHDIDKKLIAGLKRIRHYQSVEYLNGSGFYVAGRNEFIGLVKKIQEEIRSGRIKKAVLSRIHIEPKNVPFEISTLFSQLCKKYPHAFVYIFQIPRAGCWIGATPEPLILIRNHIVETISLAGTRKLDKVSPDKIKWPLKEIEEQDIVTQYIEDVLLNFNVKNFQKTGPFTQIAGNLVHLKTRFLFDEDLLASRIGEFVGLI
jgi:isochorismate synthase